MDYIDAGFQAGRGLTSGIMGAIQGNTGNNGPNPTFGQRISAGAQSAQEGYDKFMDEQTRITNAGKASDYARKAMGDDAERLTGITDAEWANMGARDRASAMQGVQEQTTMAQIMARTKLATDEAKANDFYSNVGQGLAQQINAAPADPLTGEPMTNDPNTAALIGGLSPQQQALIRSIGQAGPGNKGAGLMMVPLVKSLLAQGVPLKDAENPLEFDSTSIPGSTVVKTKRGAGFQVVPQQGGDAPEAPAGYQMVSDGRGRWKPVKTNGGELTEADRAKFQFNHEKSIDELVKTLPFAAGDADMMATIKERIGQHKSAITALGTGSGGGGAPKVATPEIAQQYLQKNGGDKEKARAAAKADGYQF